MLEERLDQIAASSPDMRCALIQNDIESPFGGQASYGCPTSKAHRIVRPRATDTCPVALLLRAAQALRISAVGDALAVDPASCFRVRHQERFDPLPARQMLAFRFGFALHHPEQESGDTWYSQVYDLRRDVPISWLDHLRSSGSRKAN